MFSRSNVQDPETPQSLRFEAPRTLITDFCELFPNPVPETRRNGTRFQRFTFLCPEKVHKNRSWASPAQSRASPAQSRASTGVPKFGNVFRICRVRVKCRADSRHVFAHRVPVKPQTLCGLLIFTTRTQPCAQHLDGRQNARSIFPLFCSRHRLCRRGNSQLLCITSARMRPDRHVKTHIRDGS